MPAASFRMFKRPGPPGEYYGYAEIEGVTYYIAAKASSKGKEWRMLGTIKRHLKADQQKLPLAEKAKDIFDDEIPF
jgi:hypothetical protein